MQERLYRGQVLKREKIRMLLPSSIGGDVYSLDQVEALERNEIRNGFMAFCWLWKKKLRFLLWMEEWEQHQEKEWWSDVGWYGKEWWDFGWHRCGQIQGIASSELLSR